jgi:hypothetical protein
MLPGAVRVLLAIVAAVLVALTAVAPHAQHGGADGNHACQACVVHGGLAASSATPDMAPRAAAPLALAAAPGHSPTFGRPLGAVPGQSPPRASL